ncbi:MAG: hypothetical protein HYZ34_01885, partial [Ignavibacteriae bacterium]|nr:hypothetical protein [Ignavibacteriota bacterium]
NWYDVEIHLHQGTEEREFQTEAIAFESRFSLFSTETQHEESHHHEDEENESAFGASMLVELEKGFHEHPDNYELRLIVGTNINEYTVTGNLILQGNFNQQIGGEQKFAFGLRRSVFETLSFGFEVDGTIQRLTSLTFTPGVFIGLSDQFDVKLGASIRSSSFTEENQIRLAAVYQIN